MKVSRKREILAAVDAAEIDLGHVLKFFQILQVNCTPDEIAEVLVIYLEQTDPLRK